MSAKIVPLSSLSGARGILCHGCYDILHVGHLRQFKQARALMGECPMIVTLTADLYIRKGPGRPIFQEQVRAEMVAALEVVDFVAVADEATALTSIQTIRPFFYVKGREYEGMGGIAALEKEAVELRGGQVVYTDRLFRSSGLVRYVELDLKGV